MAKEVVYYEVTNGYGKIPKGLRFKVEKDNSGHIDGFIRKALEDEGFSKNEIPSALSMLKLKEAWSSGSSN